MKDVFFDLNQSPNEWCRVELDEIFGIYGGFAAPQDDGAFDEEGIPFVRMQDLGRYHRTTNLVVTKDRLSEDYVRQHRLRVVPKGSILIPRSGSVSLNHRAILGVDACIVSHICALVPKISEIDVRFLYFSLCNVDMRTIMKKTTGLDAITFQDVKRMKIPLPRLKSQKAIADILQKADTLKQKQQEANLMANSILQAVFQKMFGQQIAEGKISKMGFLDVFNVTTGKLNSNAAIDNGSYPFFTCSKQTFRIDQYSFDCEALILSGNNAAGEYSVKHYEGKFDAYQRTYILTLKNKSCSYEYFQFLLETKLQELKNLSIGTNTKYLTLGIMRNIELPIPEIKHQEEFSRVVMGLKRIKEMQTKSSEEIDFLYKAIMSKAFKGELLTEVAPEIHQSCS